MEGENALRLRHPVHSPSSVAMPRLFGAWSLVWRAAQKCPFQKSTVKERGNLAQLCVLGPPAFREGKWGRLRGESGYWK